MRQAPQGRRTTTAGRLRGRTVLIGLLSLSLVTAGSSSLASGPAEDPTGPTPASAVQETATLAPAGQTSAATTHDSADTVEPAAGPETGPQTPAEGIADHGVPTDEPAEGGASTDEPADHGASTDEPADHGASTDAPADHGAPTDAPAEGGTDADAPGGAASTLEDVTPAQPSLRDDDPLRDDARPSVAPLAVPPASGNSAVITVKVGGDRSPSSIDGVAGVTLRLHNGGANGPTTAVGESWAECTSDAAGDCSFTVPDTARPAHVRGECTFWFFGCWSYEQIQVSGFNYDRRFWIVQEDAPAGWYASTALVTGEPRSMQRTPYRFQTGNQLRAGATYTAGRDFMKTGNNQDRPGSGGTWQVSRDNPQLPPTCDAGISVALVLDLSGSVAEAGAVGDLKSSAIAFAEALEGTDSSLALFTFATTAPRNTGASGRNYEQLMPIDGNLPTIRQRINGYAAEGGTNWDRGIWQVARDPQRFDLAIVITDGLATFSGTSQFGNPPGPGSFSRFAETEQAIFSANALKAQGTRVLALGVGDGFRGDADNLRAVSGATGYTAGGSASSADYFQTGWRQLAPLLENLAMGATCQSTITVNKLAEPYGGEPGRAAGWSFAATRTAGSGTVTSSSSQVTGPAGTVEYTVGFDSPDAPAATVRIEEQATAEQRAQGWELGDISCVVNDQARTVARDGDGVLITGITAGDDISCTFLNTQTLEPGVEVVKRAWDVRSAAELDEAATQLAPGASVTDGTHVTWTYTVHNTGRTSLLDIVVTDDQDVPVACPRDWLEPGEQMVCTGSGAVTAPSP